MIDYHSQILFLLVTHSYSCYGNFNRPFHKSNTVQPFETRVFLKGPSFRLTGKSETGIAVYLVH